MRRDHVLQGIAVVSFAFAAGLLVAGLPWAALGAAAQGLLVLAVARRLRRDREEPPVPELGPPPRPAAGIDLDEVDLSGVREPVEACPHCGYLGIRAPALPDGAIPGAAELMDVRVCRRCGYRGLATVFDTREDYRRFLKGLAAA